MRALTCLDLHAGASGPTFEKAPPVIKKRIINSLSSKMQGLYFFSCIAY